MSGLSQHDPFYIGPLFGNSILSAEKDWAGGMQTVSEDSGLSGSLIGIENAVNNMNTNLDVALTDVENAVTTMNTNLSTSIGNVENAVDAMNVNLDNGLLDIEGSITSMDVNLDNGLLDIESSVTAMNVNLENTINQMNSDLSAILITLDKDDEGVHIRDTGDQTTPPLSGYESITIESIAGSVIYNGIEIPKGSTATEEATEDKVLPAPIITGGGDYNWIGLR